jgi:hypothetical protein
VPGLFRIPDQLIDGLASNKLFEQGCSPGPFNFRVLRLRSFSPVQPAIAELADEDLLMEVLIF